MEVYKVSRNKTYLGQENEIIIHTIKRNKPVKVIYNYYENKPRSHCLNFRKGNRYIFTVHLPEPAKNLQALCSIKGKLESNQNSKKVFGFWIRIFFSMFVGKLISAKQIYISTAEEVHTSFAQVERRHRYRFANLKRRSQNYIVIVYSKESRQESKYKNGSKFEYNWIKLTKKEFVTLLESLLYFSKSKTFEKIIS